MHAFCSSAIFCHISPTHWSHILRLDITRSTLSRTADEIESKCLQKVHEQEKWSNCSVWSFSRYSEYSAKDWASCSTSLLSVSSYFCTNNQPVNNQNSSRHVGSLLLWNLWPVIPHKLQEHRRNCHALIAEDIVMTIDFSQTIRQRIYKVRIHDTSSLPCHRQFLSVKKVMMLNLSFCFVLQWGMALTSVHVVAEDSLKLQMHCTAQGSQLEHPIKNMHFAHFQYPNYCAS